MVRLRAAQPPDAWPLPGLRAWRGLLDHAESWAQGPLTAREHRILRTGLEMEWSFMERHFGPGPPYLGRRLHRLLLVLDRRARPPTRSVMPEWPVTPIIVSSHFGWRQDPLHGDLRFHEGIDLAGRRGDVVSASGPGRVVHAGWKQGYGRVVVLDHGSGLRTLYGHLDRCLVRSGQAVAQGDAVGLMGSSGRSTGPHLHFEVRRDDEATDPAEFLRGVRFLARGDDIR
jgi:murein DD-endopeptidase MepM/ murein hydrolase activator NlpD